MQLSNQKKIVFIGAGNMARAIIGGLRQQGWSSERIVAIDPDSYARNELEKTFEVKAYPQVFSELPHYDLAIWAIKPQVFESVASSLVEHIDGVLHVSIAAGINLKCLVSWLKTRKVVRAMPNTPMLVNAGMVGLYADESVDQSERLLVDEVLGATSKLMWVDTEASLDALTTISGCGPAYLFYFMQSMVKAGQSLGLTLEQSKTLVLQTFTGATTLASLSAEDFNTLRQRVTSPGGVTEAAIKSMQKNRVEEHIFSAIHVAYLRTQQFSETKA